MFLEALRGLTDLLKLPGLPLPVASVSRSVFVGNEVDLGQLETVLVFQHDCSHGSPTFTGDDYEALVRLEPYLKGILCPVGRRTDFLETELPKECERAASRLGEFP